MLWATLKNRELLNPFDPRTKGMIPSTVNVGVSWYVYLLSDSHTTYHHIKPQAKVKLV